jgi:hypothetical protein
VRISRTDYLLVRLAQTGASLFQSAGDLESSILRRRLDAIPIESPVFLCGLARSGTTILLEELSKIAPVGTHRYRDFPFLMVPWLRNRRSHGLIRTAFASRRTVPKHSKSPFGNSSFPISMLPTPCIVSRESGGLTSLKPSSKITSAKSC